MGNYRWLRTLFLTLVAVGSAGAAAYHWFVVRPAKACEAKGAWWDPDKRVCAMPVVISDITGRPVGRSRTPEEIAAGQARARGEPVPSRTSGVAGAAAR